jgi:hypothetical protein
MSGDRHDILIVGSGMSAVHAAQTLIEAGRSVSMIDAGDPGSRFACRVPAQDFITLRESDPDQHLYFLGESFEGIPWGPAAHTLTPPRSYIEKGTERWCPVRSDGFSAEESLAYGGLGSGWGAGCGAYADIELNAMGLDPGAIRKAYAVIADRIGVACRRDDATPACGDGVQNPHEPMRFDNSIGLLAAAYGRHREAFQKRNLVMGKCPMAVLTHPALGRGGTPYTDMEFWADHEGAVYRPWMTLDALRAGPRFGYEGGLIVLRFEEDAGGVHVIARPLAGGADRPISARRLVLAAGALGTARIVLRSQPALTSLPLLSNPYSISVCLHLRMLGRPLDRRRTSLGQLEIFHDPRRDGLGVRMTSLYTYRSLLLFKLIKEVPLAMGDARALLRPLTSALVLATINHPDRPAPGKSCRLVPDAASGTGDALRVQWTKAPEQEEENRVSERAVKWALRRLGCPVLRVQHMPPGAAVHYAGTLPFREDFAVGSLAPDGRLGGTCRVHVVDGSGFRYLPANGLTFTLMANAHVTASRIAQEES